MVVVVVVADWRVGGRCFEVGEGWRVSDVGREAAQWYAMMGTGVAVFYGMFPV